MEHRPEGSHWTALERPGGQPWQGSNAREWVETGGLCLWGTRVLCAGEPATATRVCMDCSELSGLVVCRKRVWARLLRASEDVLTRQMRPDALRRSRRQQWPVTP